VLAVVLAAFLFRWPTALVGIVVIPLSVLAATLVLWAFGSTINAIVVAGLAAALAIVIDDTVISLESVGRRLRREREARSARPLTKTILDAILEVRRPALYATLVIALALVPVFFLERLSGAFFPDLAVAFLLALLASMVVALTVTPAMCVLLLSVGRHEGGPSPLVAAIQRRYQTGLSHLLPRPRIAYAAAAGLIAVGVVSGFFLSQSLLPTFKESDLLIRWDGPPGTSLPEMDRITARASRELRSIPGVGAVGAHVGRAITGDQVVGANSGEIWVSIEGGADYGATVAAVRHVIDGYPGFSRTVETYSQDRVSQNLTGTSEDVLVRLYGEDLKTLSTQAARVRHALTGIDGIKAPRVLLPAEEPTLQVRVDLAKADRYGLKPGDVRRAATTLLSGLVVGNLFEQQKVFDVVVWGVPGIRDSLTSVRRLLIDTPGGGQVRLGDVADVRITASPGVIKRQAVSRYVDVGASVAGRDRDAVVNDVNAVLRGLRFPLEYHAEVLAAQTQPAALLIAIAVAVVVGMLLLLQALFESWRLAALALITLPMGAVGGLVAVVAAGGELSFGSYAALLAVFGITVRGGVLLFDCFRRLEQEDGEEFGLALVVRGTRERFPSLVMTSIAVVGVFLPALVMGSRAGLELVHPVAVVMVGGAISSLVVTLVVVPALYLRLGLSRAPERDSVPEPELTTVLEDLARGGFAGGIAGGVAMVETRANAEHGGAPLGAPGIQGEAQ
jgi:Cu/Ag efflux pump CusA